jgi:hypothetical protein
MSRPSPAPAPVITAQRFFPTLIAKLVLLFAVNQHVSVRFTRSGDQWINMF